MRDFSMSNKYSTPGTIEAELAEYGTYASNTRGYSMKPLFSHHRDVVVISPPDGELKKYDVALYPMGESDYILHRVIAVRESCYVIRGDNTYVKEYVPKDKVIGVLTEFTRAGKHRTCKDLSYRIYSRFWCAIYPIRLFLRKTRIALSRIYRAVFKRKKS